MFPCSLFPDVRFDSTSRNKSKLLVRFPRLLTKLITANSAGKLRETRTKKPHNLPSPAQKIRHRNSHVSSATGLISAGSIAPGRSVRSPEADSARGTERRANARATSDTSGKLLDR